jgi:serine phosphatase RsbU (regulator of sigma subunit)
MMMIQSVVAGVTRDRPQASPARVWEAVNAVLCENVRTRLERDEHATLTLMRYEDGGRLVYAGAHEDIMIHRARLGRCERLQTQGVWAGISADLPAGTTTDRELSLEPGDTILLHTDGITEAMNGAREMFGGARLCQALERAAARDVDGVRDHVLGEVRGFSSTQKDDMTVVVLRYSREPS